MMNNEDNPKFWENIYKNDDAGWDLGGPTPVFVNISSIIKLEVSRGSCPSQPPAIKRALLLTLL